jgi:ADP-ribosylglycohydrolase
MRKISYENYLDKIWGGWVGKCAGGILGAPVEGFKCFHQIELSEKLFETNYPNDDLDLQVLWLELIRQKGPWIDENDMGRFWLEHVDFPWAEYGLASRNLVCGVYPPLSGKHNNDYWNRGMGSPIRSEIWGMLCAGDPEKAAYYAKMDSSLDHYGFSVEAEMFLSACEAEAFFENDIRAILKKAISIFPDNAEIVNMYNKVVQFNLESDYETAKGKIKSYFGDADFTSSPMNVAFAVHVLLNHAIKIESVMEAVNMGHDSDCISATVGALLGTMTGYKNINSKWKKFIGNELMVSPQIKGIEHASTILGLAEQTALAGLSFSKLIMNCEIQNAPFNSETNFHFKEISLVQTEIIKDYSCYKIYYEIRNNSPEKKQISVKAVSDVMLFEREINLSLSGKTKKEIILESCLKTIESESPYFPYSLEIAHNRNKEVYNFGIPNYGEWLMLGPFVEDDKSLVPMNPEYPDHGLPSLPSISYMNHDLLAKEKEFLSFTKVKEILDDQNFNDFPFFISKIQPSSHQFHLEKHFVGRGERTIYLATKFKSGVSQKKWLCYAGMAYISTWVNGKQVAKNATLKRPWPMTFGDLIDLEKGVNYVVFRLDCPFDTINFQAGLKNFNGEHYHQSHWETNVTASIK